MSAKFLYKKLTSKINLVQLSYDLLMNLGYFC